MQSFDNQAMVEMYPQLCCAGAVNVMAESMACETSVGGGCGGTCISVKCCAVVLLLCRLQGEAVMLLSTIITDVDSERGTCSGPC